MDFRPYYEDKLWGSVLHLFCSSHAAVSCLEVVAGYRCSLHRHAERANMFAVQEGAVVIEEWDSFDQPKLIKLLHPGDIITVSSRVWHRFRVLQSGRMVEVYWADRDDGKVRMDDIERDDIGGKDNLDELRAELFASGLL